LDYSLELPRGNIFPVEIFVNYRELDLAPMDMFFSKSNHPAQDDWIGRPSPFSFGRGFIVLKRCNPCFVKATLPEVKEASRNTEVFAGKCNVLFCNSLIKDDPL